MAIDIVFGYGQICVIVNKKITITIRLFFSKNIKILKFYLCYIQSITNYNNYNLILLRIIMSCEKKSFGCFNEVRYITKYTLFLLKLSHFCREKTAENSF